MASRRPHGLGAFGKHSRGSSSGGRGSVGSCYRRMPWRRMDASVRRGKAIAEARPLVREDFGADRVASSTAMEGVGGTVDLAIRNPASRAVAEWLAASARTGVCMVGPPRWVALCQLARTLATATRRDATTSPAVRTEARRTGGRYALRPVTTTSTPAAPASTIRTRSSRLRLVARSSAQGAWT
jgi:hypothetical protein